MRIAARGLLDTEVLGLEPHDALGGEANVGRAFGKGHDTNGVVHSRLGRRDRHPRIFAGRHGDDAGDPRLNDREDGRVRRPGEGERAPRGEEERERLPWPHGVSFGAAQRSAPFSTMAWLSGDAPLGWHTRPLAH